MGKDQSEYKEVTYEGYGPHGVAVFVDTLTDNTTRTVADVRSIFNKFNGNMGTTGSLSFLFDHKCVFTFKIMALKTSMTKTTRRMRLPFTATRKSLATFKNI